MQPKIIRPGAELSEDKKDELRRYLHAEGQPAKSPERKQVEEKNDKGKKAF